MTPLTTEQYRAALKTLGLTQRAAGDWLGVSFKTAQRYATTGPSGAASRAITMALERRWRPIETAPRDGTPILTLAPSLTSGHEVLSWHPNWRGGSWCASHGDGDPVFSPTHWQPLPEPPQ